MNDIQFGWVAGFIEGEGSFSSRGSGKGCISVNVSQVQKEPLERLLKYFGGTIYYYEFLYKNPIHRWVLSRNAAADLMKNLYPVMSPRRQGQIAGVLKNWSESYGKGARQAARTHCPKGHEYTPENTYRQPSKPNTRKCRTCADEYFKTYQRKTAQVRN